MPAETLRWTDVVYDIFDLPRGFDITRGNTLALYSEDSARELKRLRDKAIEDRSGFTMDAEIVTEKGIKRWMRITATVECDGGTPKRIFGMKQDITEEKNLADRTRYLAEFDVLTGLANRSRFQSMLAEAGEIVLPDQRAGALMLIDMDGFKSINDSYGHAAGDDCLKEAGQRLMTICEQARLVSRIGGDEFAVLTTFDDATDLVDMCQRIVEAIARPFEHRGMQLCMGASVGVATFDACLPSDLLICADIALYEAKAAGRNTFRIYEAAKPLNGLGSRMHESRMLLGN
ncbi:GGDEF domain-containing protein [Corticibacterium sp. UT-5YL-CI-8]|nr:GGDEF domain-containing protein [Tianweitania sp. UT-5YL-CI-8]